MLSAVEQAAAEAIYTALEERHTLTPEEQALKPSELAARRALAAAATAQASTEAGDGWSWAVIEVMGHRRHVGRVREEMRYGVPMVRVDVPIDGDPEAKGWLTHFYPGSALFGETPCTRDAALKANKPYERPAQLTLPARYADADSDLGDDPDMPL